MVGRDGRVRVADGRARRVTLGGWGGAPPAEWKPRVKPWSAEEWVDLVRIMARHAEQHMTPAELREFEEEAFEAMVECMADILQGRGVE